MSTEQPSVDPAASAPPPAIPWRRRAGWAWRVALGVALTIGLYLLVLFPVGLAAVSGVLSAGMPIDEVGSGMLGTLGFYYGALWPVVAVAAVAVGSLVGAPLSILADRSVLRGRGGPARAIAHGVVGAIVGIVVLVGVLAGIAAVDGGIDLADGTAFLGAGIVAIVIAGALAAGLGHWLAGRILPGTDARAVPSAASSDGEDAPEVEVVGIDAFEPAAPTQSDDASS